MKVDCNFKKSKIDQSTLGFKTLSVYCRTKACQVITCNTVPVNTFQPVCIDFMKANFLNQYHKQEQFEIGTCWLLKSENHNSCHKRISILNSNFTI